MKGGPGRDVDLANHQPYIKETAVSVWKGRLFFDTKKALPLVRRTFSIYNFLHGYQVVHDNTLMTCSQLWGLSVNNN